MRPIATLPLALPFLVAVACGGGSPKAEVPGPASSASTSAPPVDAGPTTTTTMIPDGGDLTGVKLTSSSTTTIQNDAGGAPAAGGSSPDHDPGRSVQDIQTIILSRRDQARACYDASLKNHPGIEGKVDIKWTIDPKGNVTAIAVDDAASDIHEPSVGACIITIIKAIKFAESKPDAKWPQGRESHMHYPYDFHPKGKQVTPVPGN